MNNDTLLYIFDFLRVQDLIKVRPVCKFWDAMAKYKLSRNRNSNMKRFGRCLDAILSHGGTKTHTVKLNLTWAFESLLYLAEYRRDMLYVLVTPDDGQYKVYGNKAYCILRTFESSGTHDAYKYFIRSVSQWNFAISSKPADVMQDVMEDVFADNDLRYPEELDEL